MEKKRVSMRQIAKECGCSLAAVSYALNRSGQGKISSATRLRIIETAKKLNYSPEQSPRKRTGRAAILVTAGPGDGAGRRAHLMDLACRLTEQLRKLSISAVIMEIDDLVERWKQVRSLAPDILYILDGGHKAIDYVDPPCVQPVVFVDSDNKHDLYYKILPNYPALRELAARRLGEEHPFLLTETVRSAELLTLMTDGLPSLDVFVNDGGQDLEAFLAAHKGRKGIVVGDLLAVEACRHIPPENLAVISALEQPGLFPKGLTVFSVPNRIRAERAAQTGRDLLNLNYDHGASNRILLDAESALTHR